MVIFERLFCGCRYDGDEQEAPGVQDQTTASREEAHGQKDRLPRRGLGVERGALFVLSVTLSYKLFYCTVFAISC